MKRRITLYLQETATFPFVVPSYLVCEGESTHESRLGDEGDFDSRSKPSINGLCVLITLNYLLLKKNHSRERRQQCHTPRHGNALFTLWNSKNKNTQNWQKKVFGCNPYYSEFPYLVRKGSKDNIRLWIDEGVEIDIVLDTNRGVKKLRKDVIEELLEHILTNGSITPNSLTISLETQDQLIHARSYGAHLNLNSRFRVKVVWNYRDHLAIFWVSRENEITSLYPHLKLDGYDEYEYEESGTKEKTVIVPPSKSLEIDNLAGCESCVVIVSEDIPSQDTLERYKQILAKNIHYRDCLFQPETPIQEFVKIAGAKQKRKRLAKSTDCMDWGTLHGTGLEGIAKELHILHVTNK